MIEIFKTKTCMGQGHEPLGSVLTIPEINNLDSIGYSSKDLEGNKTTRRDYLNSLGKGEFEIIQTKYDNGDFCEEFIIVRHTN